MRIPPATKKITRRATTTRTRVLLTFSSFIYVRVDDRSNCALERRTSSIEAAGDLCPCEGNLRSKPECRRRHRVDEAPASRHEHELQLRDRRAQPHDKAAQRERRDERDGHLSRRAPQQQHNRRS